MDDDIAPLTAAMRAVLETPWPDPHADPLPPSEPPTLITLPLRHEAAEVLQHLAEYFSEEPAKIAENILASRLRSIGIRQHRKGYR
jgi:hypothetical protein